MGVSSLLDRVFGSGVKWSAGAGEHTECHEGEEGAKEVDEDEPEADADDAAAALPHLVVGWEEADGDEEGGDDADDYHGVVDAAVVEGLLGG